VERFIEALRMIEGAYSLVCLTNKKMIGARDPLGIRPLVLGEFNGAYILASETCALDIIGARFVREIENGEVVVITDEGVESLHPFPRLPARPCIFEYIYFSRPDSILGGRSVYEVRKATGRELAQESPVEADVVIPVPDSGVPAALGFAQASGSPSSSASSATTMSGAPSSSRPSTSARSASSSSTTPTAPIISGKRIVLVDDSIVRGTTSHKIVRMMYEAGAREVHMRIASPPIRHPDFYGIDTPEQHALLAATHSLEEMRAYIGVESLAFLSVDGVYRSVGLRAAIRRARSSPTTASPATTRRRSPTRASPGLPRQLSLLAEAG
jgi:amidophosphoribosyltransferase